LRLQHFSCQEELSEVFIASVQHIGLRVTSPLFLTGFNETRILSTDFSEKKNAQKHKI
jgi:hypothetical protein